METALDPIYGLAAIDQRHLFAACASGLRYSDDGGTTWHSAYESLNLTQTLTTTTVALSPDFASDQTVFAGVPGGVLRSITGGKSWDALQFPTPPPTISTLAVSPNFTHDGIVFAGTLEDGIYRSHWKRWNFGLLDLSVLSMALSPTFADDETAYLGTESGLFYSTNGGRAWRETEMPFGFDVVLGLALSPSHGSDGVIFAGTESRGLWRSNDFGETWVQSNGDVEFDLINQIMVTAKPEATLHLVALHQDTLYSSRDAGRHWAMLQQNVRSFATIPESCDRLLVGYADNNVAVIDMV